MVITFIWFCLTCFGSLNFFSSHKKAFKFFKLILITFYKAKLYYERRKWTYTQVDRFYNYIFLSKTKLSRKFFHFYEIFYEIFCENFRESFRQNRQKFRENLMKFPPNFHFCKIKNFIFVQTLVHSALDSRD